MRVESVLTKKADYGSYLESDVEFKIETLDELIFENQYKDAYYEIKGKIENNKYPISFGKTKIIKEIKKVTLKRQPKHINDAKRKTGDQKKIEKKKKTVGIKKVVNKGPVVNKF